MNCPREVILQKLVLHKGSLIGEHTKFVCKCRFSHKFEMHNEKSWCSICESKEFNDELVRKTTEDLIKRNIDLKVVKIDKYGHGEFMSSNGQLSEHDINEIPDICEIKDDYDEEYGSDWFDNCSYGEQDHSEDPFDYKYTSEDHSEDHTNSILKLFDTYGDIPHVPLTKKNQLYRYNNLEITTPFS